MILIGLVTVVDTVSISFDHGVLGGREAGDVVDGFKESEDLFGVRLSLEIGDCVQMGYNEIGIDGLYLKWLLSVEESGFIVR